MSKFKIVAKTLAGLENVLADEIKALGAESVSVERRAVSFIGDQEMMYKANFHLRTAIKILKPIAEFEVTNRDELYDHAKEIPWTNYLALGKSFAIDA
ncbi:MAG TPA: THUMP domain-containing protein, partial [Prolixibacteraceae bacterium]